MGNEPLFVSIANLGKRLFAQPQQTQNQTPVPAPLTGQMNVDPASVTKKVFNDTRTTVRNLLGGEAKDSYIGINDPSKQQTVAFKTPNIDPTGMVGLTEKVSAKAAEPIFKGFSDISTKLLEKLKGRTTVSRQFIEDLTNSPDLKQPERDLIRRILGENGPTEDKTLTKLLGDEPIRTSPLDFSALDNDGRWTTQKMAEEFKVNPSQVKQLSVDINELPAPSFKGDPNPDQMSSLSGQPAIKVVIDEKGRVKLADGNHRLNQAIENGDSHIPAWVVDKRTPTTDQISVPDFANKVKSELLPLTRGTNPSPRYENINLPTELRGPVGDYKEHIYNSPIKTSAGDVHFSNVGNSMLKNTPDSYFAHTRVEDLPTNQGIDTTGKGLPYRQQPSDTRRVIEIQSDLFQKGRLEGEAGQFGVLKGNESRASIGEEELAKRMKVRDAELAKLEPYRNTWHERVIREEVKQAAKDGKTKLQFPTGETAMKIEGLGEDTVNNPWLSDSLEKHLTDPDGVKFSSYNKNLSEMKNDLYVGQPIKRSREEWIITDVLGDGKFKAVPKEKLDGGMVRGSQFNFSEKLGENEQAVWDRIKFNYAEEFDISGKVDTENPIYKFYEKTVQKYLTNKYGGKVITDPQGVKWVEIDVKPEYKGLPIEAFGAGAIPLAGMGETSDNERRFKSTPVDTTSLFINTQ